MTPIEPTFIKYPEIMPLFTQFANIYSDYREKMEADFNHWDTNVGHMASEEEDLEDNEQMRDLEKQQHELEEAMIQAHDRSREIVMELHTCYQRLSNDEIEIEHSDDSEVRVQSIENFWAGQLVLYSIYQHEGAHLLTT